MCEEDFSQFTDYFNQKETNDRNIQLNNEDWINKEKDKEIFLDKQDTEVNKEAQIASPGLMPSTFKKTGKPNKNPVNSAVETMIITRLTNLPTSAILLELTACANI